MGEYSTVSGIKVLDRAIAIMMAATNQPSTLSDLCEATGLPRATAHRLATALKAHRILARTPDGKWTAGSALPGNRDRLIEAAAPFMNKLLKDTGESVQLYQLTGNTRTCVAAKEPSHGLHNVVPVGRKLPLTSGSAARIFAAFTDIDLKELDQPHFTQADVDTARTHGLAESIEEREAGLASLSAPILDASGALLGVLSISGSAERFRPSPTAKFGQQLADAATQLSAQL